MEPIFPKYVFGSVNLPAWQNNVIRCFSEHRRYRILWWEFGPTLFECLCKQKGLNAKELQQKNEKRETLEKECLELLETFGEMKAYWWWPWSQKIKDIKMTKSQEERAINYDKYSLFWRVVLGVFTNVIVRQWRIVQYGYFYNYQQLTNGEQAVKKIAIGLATGLAAGATVAAITTAAVATKGYSYLTSGASSSNALVATDRYSNLIRAVVLSHNFDGDSNMTLNKSLGQFKLQWILTRLDMSLKEVEKGKKSKEEHNTYAKERIKDFQKLSLKYHPDKQIVDTSDMQKMINETKKALNSVHDYVMKESYPNQKYGYIYRLFGELPVSLINSGKDLFKIINVAACSKLHDLAYWEEGRLMESRNHYLEEVKGYYIELLKNKLGLVKKILSSKEPRQEAKNCIDSINKIKSSFDKYNEEYKKFYEEVWLENLKLLSKECRSSQELKIIKPEIEKLLKEAEEQYKMLKSNKAGKAKPDEIFVRPMLEYSNLINMYHTFIIKLCENIESCFGIWSGSFDNDFFEQQKFALGEEETEFTEISKKYIGELSYQELSQFLNFMVSYYYHGHNTKELTKEINKYYQGNIYAKKEIGNIIVFALNRLTIILKEELKPQETFFEKEKVRIEEAIEESKKVNESIKAIEARNRELEEWISREAQRAEQNAQRAEQNAQKAEQLKLEKVIVKAFSKKISKYDDDFQEIIEKSEDEIVEAVVQHVMEHNSSPEQVLNAVIEEIKCNKNQVLRDGTVDAELIETGIRNVLSQSTSLSDVSISSGVNVGMNR